MPKKYVQNLIEEEGEKIADLLMNPDSHYYVCGDARMADGCFEACLAALQKYKKMSRVNAVAHLKGKAMDGTWQTDVWGIVSNYEVSEKIVQKEKQTVAKIWMSFHSKAADEDD